MARLMILGAGVMQCPIIKKAKDLGHYIITIDQNINAVGNRFSDKPLEIDTKNLHEIVNAAINLKIDGIITTSDYPVRIVAEVCERLKLKGPKINATKICTNKFLMREHLVKHKFKVPKYKIINNEEDINSIDFLPAVIKPLDSSGSRGVRRVNTIEECITAFPNAKLYSHTDNVLIEEFINGQEFSVETLSQNGKTHIIAITEKTVKGKNGLFFVEDRHVIPASLTKNQNQKIYKTVIKLIDSLDLGDSASHTELKLSGEDVFIIEIGARLGGDFITSDLVPLATGVDMLDNVIRLALGETIEVKHTKQKYSGIQFINSANYESANKMINSNISYFERFSLETFLEKELESSFDRLGYFIAVTEKREDLIKLLNLKK